MESAANDLVEGGEYRSIGSAAKEGAAARLGRTALEQVMEHLVRIRVRSIGSERLPGAVKFLARSQKLEILPAIARHRKAQEGPPTAV
ncbi:MAG: hypothetical protein ACI8TQ_002563 [Planctomycetota bacterium]|jgi:hypothetical protein